MSKIKVALVGVGNCASALVQGVHYYTNIENEADAVGLRHLFIGKYHPRDIEFVSAFDVEARKVHKDLSQAIFAPSNNTLKLVDVPRLQVPVQKGPVLDGVGESLKDVVKISASPAVKISKELEKSDAEIVVNLLPSGASKASHYYVEETLKAGCAFVNITPTFIASDVDWGARFKKTGLPLAGDDLEDQVGATILHKVILGTLVERGVRILETYQLDVGGGIESRNTLERARELKRDVKTKAVETVLPYKTSVVAGSTDYVDFLENRRDSYFWIKGCYFGGVDMQLDLRLNSVEAPNAGSVVLDVLRSVKIALDRGIAGPLLSVSSYAFKHPPQSTTIENAKKMFIDFVDGKTDC